MTAETPKPKVEIRDITPQLAASWIQRNHEKQRRRRPLKVAEYADDMRRDEWPLATQVIAFDVDGNLINGQHTLEAVVKSGKTIQCIVLWNAPRKAMLVIDSGLKRSTDDHFLLAGKLYPRGCGSTVRRLLDGFNGPKKSINDQQVDRFMQNYASEVAFAHKITSGHKFAPGPIRAVVARAKIKRVPAARLERFMEVLGSGIMKEGENGAVLLRNVIVAMRAKTEGILRRQLYALAEYALASFLKNDPVTKLIVPDAELFPIAEDRQPETNKESK